MGYLSRFILMAACATGAAAQTGPTSQSVSKSLALALCDTCGTVQSVQQEQQKGKGGLVGMAGGAVLGGLLGHQVGKGSGNTVATVGGAVAGGVLGNEVQKKMSGKVVWVTTVKMRDGSVRRFEQEPQPGWATGQVVRVQGDSLGKY